LKGDGIFDTESARVVFSEVLSLAKTVYGELRWHEFVNGTVRTDVASNQVARG